MFDIINLTPHEVVIINHNQEVVMTFPACDNPARVAEKTIRYDPYKCKGVEIPHIRKYYGEVENLPDFKPNTLYIVSAIVANASPGHGDLVFPADLVRDEKGNVVGCRSLASL